MRATILAALTAALLCGCTADGKMLSADSPEWQQRMQMLNATSSVWQKQYGQPQPRLQCESQTWNNTVNTTCW